MIELYKEMYKPIQHKGVETEGGRDFIFFPSFFISNRHKKRLSGGIIRYSRGYVVEFIDSFGGGHTKLLKKRLSSILC
jgi:hypothetical protein